LAKYNYEIGVPNKKECNFTGTPAIDKDSQEKKQLRIAYVLDGFRRAEERAQCRKTVRS
jgi:hypothetical protein